MVIWNTPEIAQNPLILGNTQAITVRFRDSKQTATYLKTQMRIILALNLKFTDYTSLFETNNGETLQIGYYLSYCILNHDNTIRHKNKHLGAMSNQLNTSFGIKLN